MKDIPVLKASTGYDKQDESLMTYDTITTLQRKDHSKDSLFEGYEIEEYENNHALLYVARSDMNDIFTFSIKPVENNQAKSSIVNTLRIVLERDDQSKDTLSPGNLIEKYENKQAVL